MASNGASALTVSGSLGSAPLALRLLGAGLLALIYVHRLSARHALRRLLRSRRVKP